MKIGRMPFRIVRNLAPWAVVTSFAFISTHIEAAGPVSFVRDVAPILAVHCQGCHHAGKAAMGFDLSSFEHLKRGGKQSGPDEMIVPGKPQDSRLVEVIEAEAEPRMPYKLRPLPEASIALIARWIAEGAKFDAPDPKTPLLALIDPATALKAQAAIGEPTVARPDTKASKSAARTIALSPDARWLALDHGNRVDLYETAANAEPRKSFGPLAGNVSAIAFSHDGKMVYVAHGRPGIDGSVAVFDAATGKKAFDTPVHRDQILSLAMAPDGKSVATVSYDRTIAVIDAVSGQKRQTLEEHTDSVYDVAFSPTDPDRLASASADRSVKLWSLKTSKRIETLSDATGEMLAVAFSPDGKTVFGGGADRTLRAWDIAATPPKLVRSALAHEGPIDAIAIAPGTKEKGSELITAAQDKSIKRWSARDFEPVGTPRKFEDWPAALAIRNGKLALAELSGAAWLLDPSKPEAPASWIRPINATKGGTPDSFKPQLVRLADLGRPSPAVVTANSNVVVTLSGQGVGNTLATWVSPADVKFEIMPHDPPQPNSVKLSLQIPPRTGTDSVRVRLLTPLGVTGEQSILVIPGKIRDLAARMPGDSAELPEFAPGETIRTTIAAPGQIFATRIKAAKGETVTVRSLGRSAGSSLTERLTFESPDGKVLASAEPQPGRETILSHEAAADGEIVLKVRDAVFSAGGNHFALLERSPRPVVSYHWPPAVGRNETVSLTWNSRGGRSALVPPPKPADAAGDSIRTVSISAPQGWISDRPRSILAVPGRTIRTNAKAEILQPGDAAVGLFGSSLAVHSFRFEAKSGDRRIIETFARRLGYDTDTIIGVTDSQGKPVVLARFRKVADTLVDFRDHTSRQKTIRLTRWPEFRMNDYVLIGREIARIFNLPKNPDDDCQFYGDEARWGYFGTTPEQVPQGRTVTRLELLPPGDSVSVDPSILHEALAVNDDGGMKAGNDSYLDFVAPADGIYTVTVRETGNRFGPTFGYALVVRKPQPDFELQFSPMDWNVPSGGNRVVTATIRRFDGFEGPVDVVLEGLPKSLKATKGRIERGQLACDMLIEHVESATGELPPEATWKLVETADIGGQTKTRTIDGSRAFWAITPKSNLKLTASTAKLQLTPGQIVEMRLKVDRSEPFKGRVPVDVRNLPYGVRVLDIGLNGVLITEKETERTIRIFAEEWVEPQSRPFFAVGRAESAGTADSAPPVVLEISPRQPSQVTAAAGSSR